jgi:hypothetical protein
MNKWNLTASEVRKATAAAKYANLPVNSVLARPATARQLIKDVASEQQKAKHV